MTAPLGVVRILELAGPGGASICGRVLADLGADVIKVEPPGGCPTRVQPGFTFDNLNKRSITLRLESEMGRALFRRLVARADVVVESTPPGRLAGLGLDYPSFREEHPTLVWTSITPFGRTGPKAGWAANDFVAFAAGGIMYISGKPEGPPVVAPGEQAYRLGGFHGAFGAMAALWQRRTGHSGQFVEVSLQECLAAQENLITDFSRKGEIIARTGSQHKRAVPGRVYPCQDGFVHLMVAHTQADSWARFLDWLGRPAALADPRLEHPVYRREHSEQVDAVVREFLRPLPREVIYREAQARKIPCAPVNTPADVVHDEQIRSRGFVQTLEGDPGSRSVPGLPFKTTEGGWLRLRRAPGPGEHNAPIYVGELGLDRRDLAAAVAAGTI